MRKIEDVISLVGEYETLSMMELRQHPGDVFKQVELGKVFIIKRGKKVVGIIQKPPADMITVVESDGSISYEPVESHYHKHSQ